MNSRKTTINKIINCYGGFSVFIAFDQIVFVYCSIIVASTTDN